jgi:hypothetical protein
MMHLIVADLLVPGAALPPEGLRRALDAMVDAGFLFEREPGAGGSLWFHADLDWRSAATLDEAIDGYALGEDEWSVELWTRAADAPDQWLDVHLSVTRAYAEPHQDALRPFVTVRLSLGFRPQVDEYPTLCREFAAWAGFLAGLVRPWYGRGFHFWLAGADAYDYPTGDALERLDPHPIEWLNVYGPAYVARIGLERLLSAPAWRVDFLPGGAVAVLLGPHPAPDDRDEYARAAHRVAAHLGVPCLLDTPKENARRWRRLFAKSRS